MLRAAKERPPQSEALSKSNGLLFPQHFDPFCATPYLTPDFFDSLLDRLSTDFSYFWVPYCSIWYGSGQPSHSWQGPFLVKQAPETGSCRVPLEPCQGWVNQAGRRHSSPGTRSCSRWRKTQNSPGGCPPAGEGRGFSEPYCDGLALKAGSFRLSVFCIC